MIEIYSDASCDQVRSGDQNRTRHRQGRSRRAGWGYVVVRDGEIIREESGKFHSDNTILAELYALRMALQSEYAVAGTILKCDCQHVVRLMHGEQISFSETPAVRKARHRAAKAKVAVHWLPSHDGNEYLRRADLIASEAVGRAAAGFYGIA